MLQHLAYRRSPQPVHGKGYATTFMAGQTLCSCRQCRWGWQLPWFFCMLFLISNDYKRIIIGKRLSGFRTGGSVHTGPPRLCRTGIFSRNGPFEVCCHSTPAIQGFFGEPGKAAYYRKVLKNLWFCQMERKCSSDHPLLPNGRSITEKWA